MRMEGKVAIVTGAASGIGKAIASLFADEGACVTVADINTEDGQKVSNDIVNRGGKSIFVCLDVTDEENWKNVVAVTVKEFSKVNVLVNNAGIYRSEVVHETSLETWQRVMAVNSTGAFLGSKHVIPEMKKDGGGSIVNMSSGAGIVGNDNGAAYGPSKGASRILTKATAAQYGKFNIRANSIHPGPIDTPMLTPNLRDPETQSEALAPIPLCRIAQPLEVALGALYLASDDSSYVTGVELPIDGGRVNV